MQADGGKRTQGQPFSAPAERNKEPIADVLRRVLPSQGLVLEIASGTGQHVVHFAKAFPGLAWQPSDADAELREAAASRIRDEQLANVRPPIALDVRKHPWPVQAADAIVCINMIHIAPWAATLGLFEGAKAVLRQQHVMFMYGPYRRHGRHTAESNARFDADLRARDAAWGVRDLEAVSEVAGRAGFALTEIVEMPANNLSLVFARGG